MLLSCVCCVYVGNILDNALKLRLCHGHDENKTCLNFQTQRIIWKILYNLFAQRIFYKLEQTG